MPEQNDNKFEYQKLFLQAIAVLVYIGIYLLLVAFSYRVSFGIEVKSWAWLAVSQGFLLTYSMLGSFLFKKG